MKFEHYIKNILEFCQTEIRNFRKGKVTKKLKAFSIKLTVSAITERQQLPEAKRAKTVASRLAESTSPSTEVQGNEEGLAYIKKTTPLETKSPLMDRFEITAEYQR